MIGPISKYQPEEILQIIQANYVQQQQFDDIVLKNYDLTFETTISDWQDICDLVDTSELFKYLNYYFHLEASRETWMDILEPEEEKTLGDLCNFVADTAEKEVIEPIKIMGDFCSTAAIFKSLKKRLEDRGLDVSDIRPSSQLEPLVKKYKSVLIEEINQIDPRVLPPIEFKTNWVYKWGFRLLLTFIFVTGFLAYRKSNWAWAAGGVCSIGYGMIWLGAWLNPKRASFKNIYTVADLVRKIDQQKPGPSKALSARGSLH
jgi:hypothetical protein